MADSDWVHEQRAIETARALATLRRAQAQAAVELDRMHGAPAWRLAQRIESWRARLPFWRRKEAGGAPEPAAVQRVLERADAEARDALRHFEQIAAGDGANPGKAAVERVDARRIVNAILDPRVD